MWKSWFYFSLADRRSIAVLLVVAGCLLTANLLHLDKEDERQQTDTEELDRFMAAVTKAEQTRRQAYLPTNTQPAASLFVFDPNSIDADGLSRLGLSPFVANNIIKYRNKGGRFRQASDLKRIYGLSETQYEQLAPYIAIAPVRPTPQPEHIAPPPETAPTPAVPHTSYTEKYPEGTVIDLNAADTTELKKIPGIGSYYARQIVQYGRTLGGYADVGQLKEISGLPENIAQWFTINTPPHPSLRINYWDVERLRRHPYLSFYQARTIVEHRHKYGRITDLSALSLYPEFAAEDLRRLQPYVRFD